MDYYFCLISGDVLTNFTNIVELIPCTAADSFNLYFHFYFAIKHSSDISHTIDWRYSDVSNFY